MRDERIVPIPRLWPDAGCFHGSVTGWTIVTADGNQSPSFFDPEPAEIR
jgi:hypothetical protein